MEKAAVRRNGGNKVTELTGLRRVQEPGTEIQRGLTGR